MERNRIHFETIDSTNTWAKRHASELPVDKLTLITASEQTAGRGRFKRRWESPAHLNVYATFCFFVDQGYPHIGNIPQVLAMSAADVLQRLDFHPLLKWPNDILLSKKKVGGILCETVTQANKICVVAGIGINVNMPLETLKMIDRPATSLAVESGHQHDIDRVIELLQSRFSENLPMLLQNGFTPFLSKYCNSLIHATGDKIRFDDNRMIWDGTFHTIHTDGSLNLLLPDGSLKNCICGEIPY